MAKVAIVYRECSKKCVECNSAKILARWKNANKHWFHVKTLLQTISNKKKLNLLKQLVQNLDVSEIVLFVNLDCREFPKKSAKDSADIKRVADRLAEELPECKIFGILHQKIEKGYQGQYAAMKFASK